MRLEVNSNRFEISNYFEKSFRLHVNFTMANLEISNLFQKLFSLHGDFNAETFQTIVRFQDTGGLYKRGIPSCRDETLYM